MGFIADLFGFEDAPPPPDYTGAAVAQGQASQELANQQTWANRPTQLSPWGSSFWTAGQAIDPATGKPVTTWSQETQLDPAIQQALDNQLAMQAGRSALAQGMMGNVAQDFSQPFNWSALTGMAGTPQQQFTYGRDAQTYVPSYALDTGAPRQLTSGYESVSPTTQTADQANFVNERQRIENALFERMRPEQQREEDRVRTMLANQGLTPGSEAYNQELQRLGDQQARERFNALEMGGQEQARLQQMLMGQQAQAFGQREAAGRFGLGAQQQAFGQDVGAQQAYNQALAQQQAMQAAQAGFYNQAQQQLFGQDQAANAQNYAQMMQAAEYQNRLRQQQIGEQQLQRTMSLNELNALISGQQAGMPQFPSFQGASIGQAPQLLSAAQAGGQYGLNAAAMQNQFTSDIWGDIAKMAGAAAMAMGSDRRLKSDLVRVGTHKSGVGIYEYTIFGHRERGVLAQELQTVRPDLVSVGPDEMLMVNYGGLNG